jgi:hypothetical protein
LRVRRTETEAVPPATPGLPDAGALEDDMLGAGPLEFVARGESGLTRPDDDDVDVLHVDRQPYPADVRGARAGGR